jgi:hypothetical protein
MLPWRFFIGVLVFLRLHLKVAWLALLFKVAA